MAYVRKHPLPDTVTHAMLAQLCAIVANALRDSKKQKRAYDPADFYPGDPAEKSQAKLQRDILAALGVSKP